MTYLPFGQLPDFWLHSTRFDTDFGVDTHCLLQMAHRLFNLAFFEEIVVKDRAIAKTQYQVPFRQLLGAQQGKSVLNKELLVVVMLSKENRPLPARLNED